MIENKKVFGCNSPGRENKQPNNTKPISYSDGICIKTFGCRRHLPSGSKAITSKTSIILAGGNAGNTMYFAAGKELKAVGALAGITGVGGDSY